MPVISKHHLHPEAFQTTRDSQTGYLDQPDNIILICNLANLVKLCVDPIQLLRRMRNTCRSCLIPLGIASLVPPF